MSKIKHSWTSKLAINFSNAYEEQKSKNEALS